MKKILVVDDDPGVCKLLRTRLKSRGYDVIEAYNGVEAFAKASDERPDLIILDVSMPIMDGYEFVRSTRWLDLRDIPILILSARVNTREMFDAMGVPDFLAKPFNFNELLGKVEECIKN
jgi:DNA-binding response OmpR family regulator